MSVDFAKLTGVTPSIAAERYAHGTRARYGMGKCRCLPCRAAASEYESQRQFAIKGPWRVDGRGGRTRVAVRNVVTGEVDLRTEERAIAKRAPPFLTSAIMIHRRRS